MAQHLSCIQNKEAGLHRPASHYWERETGFEPATSVYIESKNRRFQIDQADRLKNFFKRFAESVHIVARQTSNIDTTGVDDIDRVLLA